MGRSFANLHIKRKTLRRLSKHLRELSEGHAEVLGKSSIQDHTLVPLDIV